jgi:hypothetical protein
MPLKTDKKLIDCRFASLGAPKRIFAVPSIHASLPKLQIIHEHIWSDFQPGDRLVYLGNYTGHGAHSKETIDSLLTFRRCLLSIAGVQPTDIIYLHGQQEEMWQKLLQLQFAPNPAAILEWMLEKGLAQTLESYCIDLHEAKRVSREGVIRLARWTERVRCQIHEHAGHNIFGAQCKRAAFTECSVVQASPYNQTCAPLLFVNAGIDSTKPLDDQGDAFWWGHNGFKHMARAYSPYQTIFRGYDPDNHGLNLNKFTATLDNSCGRGGNLVYAQISGDGEILQLREA